MQENTGLKEKKKGKNEEKLVEKKWRRVGVERGKIGVGYANLSLGALKVRFFVKAQSFALFLSNFTFLLKQKGI